MTTILEQLVQLFVKKDTTINALQSERDAYKAQRDEYKAESELLTDELGKLKEAHAEEAEIKAEIEAIIDQFDGEDEPEELDSSTSSENDESNPTQAVDEAIEIITNDPSVDTDSIDTSTVGTSEPTPVEVLEEAVKAAEDAIAGGNSPEANTPETVETDASVDAGATVPTLQVQDESVG